MKKSQCHSNLWSDETTSPKTVAKVVVELVPPTRLETSAASQTMPPTGLTDNLGPVSRIGGEQTGYAAVYLHVVVNALVAPGKIQWMQVVWNALGIQTQPLKDSAICHLWCWSRHSV